MYKDSPSSISREDQSFKVTITGEYTGADTSAQIESEVIAPNLTGTIKKGTSSMDRMMNEEFSSLYQAIAVAVFLIFVVMAAQFESVKFSVMVMTTIPFSWIRPIWISEADRGIHEHDVHSRISRFWWEQLSTMEFSM